MGMYEVLVNGLGLDNCPECGCAVGDDTFYKPYSNKTIAICAQCGYDFDLDAIAQEAEDSEPDASGDSADVEATPGPWEVRDNKDESFTILGRNEDAGKEGVSYSGEHLTVAHVPDCREDARLIAAAPAMLEALHEALRQLRLADTFNVVLADKIEKAIQQATQ